MDLSNDEIRRYSRHLILPEVGMAGQKKLKSASVLCIGTGGLGSPIIMYLAAAGIGRIGLVDFDVVDFSNLQRQIAHGTDDVDQRVQIAELVQLGLFPTAAVHGRLGLTEASQYGARPVGHGYRQIRLADHLQKIADTPALVAVGRGY